MAAVVNPSVAALTKYLSAYRNADIVLRDLGLVDLANLVEVGEVDVSIVAMGTATVSFARTHATLANPIVLVAGGDVAVMAVTSDGVTVTSAAGYTGKLSYLVIG